jgi:hypothetical protein
VGSGRQSRLGAGEFVVTTVIAVGSVKGTGGVTSTALAVAASAAGAGEPVTLVEADPSGGSLLGWCPDLEAAGPGLYEAVFQRDFGSVGQSLGDLRVVVAQGDPWRITVALERPRGWRQLLDEVDGLVVVDVGRLFPGSSALPLVGVADGVALVSPAESSPLAATLEWIDRGGQFAESDTRIDVGRLRIVTVDVAAQRRQRLDPGRLARDELGAVHAGHVPFDDGAFDLLCRGASMAHRGLRRSRLALAVAGLAGRLSSGVLV